MRPQYPLLKNLLKRVLPKSILLAASKMRSRAILRGFNGLSAKEAFTRIYSDELWGHDATNGIKYNSGIGSREPLAIQSYVGAVKGFITSLEHKPDLVDLGCGDFLVGSQIRPYCGRYVACDIVDSLIAYNADHYKDADVDFMVCDIIEDRLPDGEIATLRQVLQHLSNAQISKVLPKVAAKYKFLVLTEHLPLGDFIPNVDKQTGPGIRLENKNPSGVVITKPPFNLPLVKSCELCRVERMGGVIVTTLYGLPLSG